MASFVGDPDLDFIVSYQTDPYPCPFPRNFIDIHRVFQGCIHDSSPASGNQHAANSIKGHQCGPDQYRDATGCHTRDPNCRNWDTLSGFCFTCNDLSSPPDGVCGVISSQPTNTTCPTGTYNNGGTCVPDNCTGVTPNDICTGCISVR